MTWGGVISGDMIAKDFHIVLPARGKGKVPNLRCNHNVNYYDDDSTGAMKIIRCLFYLNKGKLWGLADEKLEAGVLCKDRTITDSGKNCIYLLFLDLMDHMLKSVQN